MFQLINEEKPNRKLRILEWGAALVAASILGAILYWASKAGG